MVAMLNARLVEPSALVSLACVGELHGIPDTCRWALRIGAMTRHREVAELPALRGPRAVLRQAAAAIANPTIRAMGTIGGSVALDDPAADYPPPWWRCRPSIEIAGPGGTRRIAAADISSTGTRPRWRPENLLLRDPFAAACGWRRRLSQARACRWRLCDRKRRLNDRNRRSVRAVIGACGPRPVSLEAANAELARGNLVAAGALLAAASDPVDDSRASANYRRRVIPRMLARAFVAASAQARTL